MENVTQVPISDLVLDDRNARKGDVSSIMASLKEFGQHRPAVVQKSTMKVIAGNHMLLAAQALGWSEIGCLLVDDDDEKSIRRGIADNATGDRAGWNNDVLRDLLTEVGTDVPGIDDKLLAKLFAEVDEQVEQTEPVFPIVAKPGEHYSYVLIVADNLVDSMWMESTFSLRREKYYKSDTVKESRVITVERFRQLFDLGGSDRPDPEVIERAQEMFKGD